ncbi:MAG: extracellular solute-binding protein [Caldilineaceae bacterium]|nr:extracellular solute-binding protein [Caldilineaceae bacterium]
MKAKGVSRRTFLHFTAGALGVSALAACMPSSSPPPAAQQEAASGAAAPESTTGTLWGLQYDPHVATYNRLADLFKEQSGITLAVEPQGWPLETKLIAALSAGTQPDVICIMGKVMIPLHIQKAIMPLKESVYDAQGVNPETDFIGDAIGAYTWEGELYGVPTEVNSVGSFVNVPVDDVEAAGLTTQYPPTNGEPFFASYESMWELAKALQVETNGKVERWGLSSKGWDNQSYLGILRTLLANDGTDWWDNNSKSFHINSEAGVRAMELFAETPVKLGIETELDQNHADAALAGKVALARGSTGPALQGRDLGYNFFMSGVPKVIGDEPPLLVGEAGWGFAAPKNSRNPDVSLAFLRMMATEEGQRTYSMIYSGLVPAWAGLVGKFDHFADPSEDSPNVLYAKLSMDHLLPQTQYYGEGFGYPAEVDGIGGEICSLVRQGELTAAEAVAQYQERCEAQYQQFLEDTKNVTG